MKTSVKQRHVDISDMIGRTFSNISVTDESLSFTEDSGDMYRFNHKQDCCEYVYIESIVGDLDNLVGTPILVAEEIVSYDNPLRPEDDEYGTFTWTFYKFATIKGHVDVRWYGTSNGYYSESVSLEKLVSTYIE